MYFKQKKSSKSQKNCFRQQKYIDLILARAEHALCSAEAESA